MLAPFSHAVTVKLRPALRHDTHGITAGVGIDANELVPGWKHFHWGHHHELEA
jgi:hypothetical protein